MAQLLNLSYCSELDAEAVAAIAATMHESLIEVNLSGRSLRHLQPLSYRHTLHLNRLALLIPVVVPRLAYIPLAPTHASPGACPG